MITFYHFKDNPPGGWNFEPVRLGRINLLVGASGSGKTRFLNSLFNFSGTVSKGKPFRQGIWDLTVKIGNHEYSWHYQGDSNEDTRQQIKREILRRKSSRGKEEILVDRSANSFKFRDSKLPKLERDIPSVTLLKEEKVIEPIYRVFSHVQRREFHHAALQDASTFETIPSLMIKRFESKPNLNDLWSQDHPVQAKLFLFQKFFPELYDLATNFFKEIFPTIQQVNIKMLKQAGGPIGADEIMPIFLVKERGVKNWVAFSELSSGMRKVLLIVSDILSLPGDSVYIIDEYENSLGVNAIDFLPQFLIEYGGENQFFIATHHPYLINSMPMHNWLVFNRKGSQVRIRKGYELEERYGKSKQKAFIQLLNDPFYSQGIR